MGLAPLVLCALGLAPVGLARLRPAAAQRWDGAGLRVAAEQAVEVVPHHRPFLAALLKQKPRQRSLHQPVLIPLRVIANEAAHRLIQILRKLIDNAHESWGVVGDLTHRW